MGRLRRRLDGLEAHAHATLSETDTVLGFAKDLLADLADGIKIEVDILGRTLPITIRIDPREEQSK